MSISWCVVILVLIGLKDGNGCPDNFVTFQGNCYSFVDTKLSWFRALKGPAGNESTACQNKGAVLVDITSKAEDDFIRGRLQHLHAHDSTDQNLIFYWTRGNDLAAQDQWVWGFPGEVSMTYTNWGPGEPNNNKDYAGEPELCVCLWGGISHKWNDLACSLEEYYICKTEDSSSGAIVG